MTACGPHDVADQVVIFLDKYAFSLSQILKSIAFPRGVATFDGEQSCDLLVLDDGADLLGPHDFDRTVFRAIADQDETAAELMAQRQRDEQRDEEQTSRETVRRQSA